MALDNTVQLHSANTNQLSTKQQVRENHSLSDFKRRHHSLFNTTVGLFFPTVVGLLSSNRSVRITLEHRYLRLSKTGIHSASRQCSGCIWDICKSCHIAAVLVCVPTKEQAIQNTSTLLAYFTALALMVSSEKSSSVPFLENTVLFRLSAQFCSTLLV